MPMAIALLNGKIEPAALRLLGTAVGRDARTRRRRLGLRRVALGLLHRLVIGIGGVGFGGAVFQARLEPVEFRRGRRHVGVGAARGAIGLRGGTAEIIDVGGDVAEAAHARRRRQWRRRSAVLRATRRRAPGRRLRRSQAGAAHRNAGRGADAARRSGRRRQAAGDVATARAGRARGGAAGGGDAVELLSAARALARRNASPLPLPLRAPPPGREASRARWAASDSTLRTASSSDSRSRVISDSESGGCTLRSCAIRAVRARS